MIDHLFRHEYGKMVAVLTRIYGLHNLSTVEDAVQDAFVQATTRWKQHMPENPAAWLQTVAKNRAIDLLRKVQSDIARLEKLPYGPAAITLNELFLDHEIEDSQLRMIFTACHPALKPHDQIAFALKTISGFNTREIASALLTKEETVKKRLARARNTIQKQNIAFDLPGPHKIPERLNRVLEVVYLIFNEGFHSGHKTNLVREDLCGEALRLIQLLLKKEEFRCEASYALLALLCFHAARLKAKIGPDNEPISLRDQDRSKWSPTLIQLGNAAMHKATLYDGVSSYQMEAGIIVEHLHAPNFDKTNWSKILQLYKKLNEHHPTPFNLLNQGIVLLQLKNFEAARRIMEQVQPGDLEQRGYLYYSLWAEYHELKQEPEKAIHYLDIAIKEVNNDRERQYLLTKKRNIYIPFLDNKDTK